MTLLSLISILLNVMAVLFIGIGIFYVIFADKIEDAGGPPRARSYRNVAIAATGLVLAGVLQYIVKMDSLRINSSFAEITLTIRDAMVVILTVIIIAIAFAIWEYARHIRHSK